MKNNKANNAYPEDRLARLIGIPLIALIMNILHKSHAYPGITNQLISYSFSLLFTFVYWQGNRLIWMKLLNTFPLYHQTKKRLLLLALLCTVFTFAATIILENTVYLITEKGFCAEMNVFKSFFSAFIPLSICLLVYESVYFFESWKENIKKTESLARENIQSQLDSLKNQLDPHFLFNSMNTLASLIDENKDEAQKYLERLSDVYRYVLISKEKNTVSLEEEMDFLEAYVYLNKVRYRENLMVEKSISLHSYYSQVAPLSLQMLVENAIKHNVVSKDKPLKIKITDEEGYVTIENNVQEKKIFEKSTKVGLLNIINRYQLLSDKSVEIISGPLSFKVKIPLL